MSLSVFDLFKIGVGPSSSHTMGPMWAAKQFLAQCEKTLGAKPATIRVALFGSLAATGKGHATDRAVILGLLGERPDQLDPEQVEAILAEVESTHCVGRSGEYPFNPEEDILWYPEQRLPAHPNAMRFTAHGVDGQLYLQEEIYSVGGGFIATAQELNTPVSAQQVMPFEFNSARELIDLCGEHQCSVGELIWKRELSCRSEAEVSSRLRHIWQVMQACIERGFHSRGVLPGGLGVRRRAPLLYKALLQHRRENVITTSLQAMDWINLYALAVNEENASGGQVVTAPTNGAAGIIPAVLKYLAHFYQKKEGTRLPEEKIFRFFMAATAIGILCKKNASISGAEVGCQGEVGSACAMAAAGLAEALGASPEQVENAGEIGLEHNLGLTCDPVAGLVQVPCIERNAIAAVKAVNAAQMALHGDGKHFVSLDKVIKTLRETGADMQEKYKETSTGGLAVNFTEC